MDATRKRVKVRVKGRCSAEDRVGWVDRSDIESAGEKCPSVYSMN